MERTANGRPASVRGLALPDAGSRRRRTCGLAVSILLAACALPNGPAARHRGAPGDEPGDAPAGAASLTRLPTDAVGRAIARLELASREESAPSSVYASLAA